MVQERLKKKATTVCIVGLGYVGLPLAVEFARAGVKKVIGFDINEEKVRGLRAGRDFIGEFSKKDIMQGNIEYTADPKRIREADVVIAAVPTPVSKSKKPELSYLKSASKLIGENMSEGCLVVFESTVYPGVTEDVCNPILERTSGLKAGGGFRLGYSPERVNPGDREHTVDKIVTVVSGIDEESTEMVAQVYGWIVKAGVYRAPDIKTAEAAKVIENTQRDLNIALMNELSLIFDRMGLDTEEVLKAASTKWNFHRYQPGLVGGHCIPVDPYYLVYKAKELGYEPQVILAGRQINDEMPRLVARRTLKLLGEAGKKPEKARVLVMGLAFKENVNDVRTSPAGCMIEVFKSAGVSVVGYDPLLRGDEITRVFGIPATEDLSIEPVDAVVVAVAHDVFKKLRLRELAGHTKENSVLVDVKGIFSRGRAKAAGFQYYWKL